MSKSIRLFAFAAMLTIAVLSVACAPQGKPAVAATVNQEAALAVDTLTLAEEEAESRVVVTGTLAASEESTVSVEAEGRVVSLAVDLGDKVTRGGTLLRVAGELYAYQKAQADAEVEAARADYERLKDLTDKQLSSQQTLEAAKRRLDVAVAAQSYQRKKLDDTALRSPIEGTIAKRLVNEGEYVRAGTAAFYIVKTSPLKARAEVPERYATQIAKGAAVVATLEGAGVELKGKITRVSPAVSETTRSFAVEAEIENPQGQVRPGSFATLALIASTKTKGVLVPDKAIFSFAGIPRVYVVQDGKAAPRTIELGVRSGDRYLVVKGLAAGERLITSGIELLSEGRAVAPR